MAREKNHKLNSIIASVDYGKTPQFKRPSHPDFMTSLELRNIEFTGMRKNEIALQYELWIAGEVRYTVTFAEEKLDPQALAKAHIRFFGIDKGD